MIRLGVSQVFAARSSARSVAIPSVFLALALGCGGEVTDDVRSMEQRVVYGADDRQEYSELAPGFTRFIADSTLIQVQANKSGWCNSSTCTFSLDDLELCADQRFFGQNAVATTGASGVCSAWLVAPDLVITAGHCINPSQCPYRSYAFGWKVESGSQAPSQVSTSDVFNCAEVIGYEDKNEGFGDDDYALVRLDRAAERIPFIIRRTGSVEAAEELTMIGHPSGLPLKVDSNGVVKDNTDPAEFTANLDAFSVSSGSVVFGSSTGVAEGLLLGGNGDYVWDSQNQCNYAVECSDSSGCNPYADHPFESVQRITRLPLDSIPLHAALVSVAI